MKSGLKMVDEIVQSQQRMGQKTWIAIFGILAIIGAGAFLIGISGPSAGRAWQVYLVNFLFWSGLAFGTVLFSATLTMTNARWGRPLKRLAEATGAFLPVAFLLFWVLFFGKERIFLHAHESLGHKQLWLSSGFLFIRDGASFLLLTVVSSALIYYSVRRDLRFLAAGQEGRQGEAIYKERANDPQTVLSPIFGILYAIVLSLIGFDLIMSLSPHWHSTLFGAYYFVGSFYTGLAALAVLSFLSTKTTELGEIIRGKHFHDLGNLLLAFCLVTGDFFYSQFLVIWFGNLPNETRYVLLRVRESPWDRLAWTVLFICFAIPFAVLLSRKFKQKPALMMTLGITILSGMWLERFLLVVPSLWKGPDFPLGFMELLITAGFFGIVALCILLFLRKVPILPVSDPLFRENL
jgi:Ni/Fe-hydrogenase subunit HybB-like protein